MDELTKEDVFDYLECLKESGVTNMFGAAPYVQQEFGIDIKEAREWLKKWMDSYKE